MKFGKNQKRVLKDLKLGCHLFYHNDMSNIEEDVGITDDEKGDIYFINLKLFQSLINKGILKETCEMTTIMPDTETYRYDLIYEPYFPTSITGYWEEMTNRQPEVYG